MICDESEGGDCDEVICIGVNTGGDGGDASPPEFVVGGTPMLFVPPDFGQLDYAV